MRVRHVSVSGLFGIFDHEIPFHQEGRITILHGLNGTGKTILLRMIAGALRGNYSALRTTPFSTFALTFDDESVLRIERREPKSAPRNGGRGRCRLVLTLLRHGVTVDSHEERVNDEPSAQAPFLKLGAVDHITAYVPYLTRIGPDLWRHDLTDEILTEDDIVEQHRDQVPQFAARTAREEEPASFAAIRGAIQVRFVHTRRLDSFAVREDASSVVIERAAVAQPAVRRYSDEIVDQVQSVLAEYAQRSQELDRTFPARLFSQDPSAVLSFAQIQERFAGLEDKRSRLMALGLLSSAQGGEQAPPVDDPSKLGVLSIYVDDVERKLGTFNGFAQRVELFLGILNERFRYKKLVVVPERGLVATDTNGATFPLTALSSGEQHEIVMLYKLLFKIKADSLVLIDEPELSLHLIWQQRFLDDLGQIVQLAGIDILIATHSADIVDKHWDWTVALEGPAG